jgi:hypothetical protein
MAGITLLFATLGGGFGKDVIPDETAKDRARNRDRETARA